MTHDDTKMMADGADGNPPATPWCYPHLGETRGYSKAVTFSLSSRRCRGKWVCYEAGASVEVAPVDALLTSPLITAAPAKPEALPAVPREDERRTRERNEENAQRDVEEHEVEEEEE